MGKSIRKRAAMLLTAALLATALPLGILSRSEKAAVEEFKLNMTKVDGTYNKIEIYTPNVEGDFKSIIFVNGQGGPKTQEFAPYIEQWMKDGYIKPMVVFMPYFNNGNPDLSVFGKEMGPLATKIKKGEFNNAIGKNIDASELSVCGYSMGGSIAGIAGCFHKDIFVNVGELSPSPQLHYPCGGKYYVKDYSPYLYELKGCDAKFSTASNKHLFMAVGSNEGDLTDGVEYGYNKYGKDQGFAKLVFNGENEKHTSQIFRKELFCFMYYIQNNDLPSDELIYKVFGKGYTIDRVMPVKTESPTPTDTNTPTPQQNPSALSGSVNVSGYYRCYQPLNATAVNCPASKLNYQWKRDGVNISGAVSSSYTLTEADIGKSVVCVITDKDGKYTGSISSTPTTVKKGFGPGVPDVTAVDCSYEGASDGKILNVTSAMEYAKGNQNGPYTDCKGTVITGLSKGLYFVRIKATDTIAAGGMAMVNIGEKKGGPTPEQAQPTDTNTPTPANTDNITVTPIPDADPADLPTSTPVPEVTTGAVPTASVTGTPADKKAEVTATTVPSATPGVTVTSAPTATPAVKDAQPSATASSPEASGLSSGGNTYKADGKDNVIFESVNPLVTDLNVPSTVKISGKKYKVTAIAAGAFKGNGKLRSVVIGKNIRTIGKDAFRNCKKLKKVIFKTTKLKKSSVGKNAFKGIAKNATFTVPAKKYKSYKKFLPKTAKGTKIKFVKLANKKSKTTK